MHTSLLVCWRRKRVMVDCGDDWLGKAARLRPDAIAITHAHPDHAGGLKYGAPCPVFATRESWSGIGAASMPRIGHPRRRNRP